MSPYGKASKRQAKSVMVSLLSPSAYGNLGKRPLKKNTAMIPQINMFNEKIFVFLWWWFCILLFISILNLFRWLIRLSFDAQRSFITAVLESAINDDFDAREVSEFCRKTLKTDGVTIVRLIEENATIYQAAEFIVPLWQEFMQKSK
ncbi:hypothetical protein TELCIR_14627 [Teladorsagia circumcincta]|uniref:Innexin n=1 Tax=Teladorsagia circumcincta TaxID=45464 RepID=A0A2G9U0N5_TELCI|nr:hypothetical protein TELCIR_14627 [Teladorsagia circumcincta]